MADDLTPEQRRKNMQAIRSRNTGIEKALRKALWEKESDTERTIKMLLESPTSPLRSTKLPFFVTRTTGTGMIGKTGISALNQTVITGSRKLNAIWRETVRLPKHFR